MKITKNKVIFFMVCIYPIIPYYFNIFGINASNLIALIIIALFIISNRGNKLYLNKSLLVYIFIFACLFRSVSIAINGSIESLFYLIKILIPFLFLMQEINTKEKFLTVIEMLVYVSGVLCIFGIIEEITKFNIFSLLNNSGTSLNYNELRLGLMRIISFTGQTITYGIYITFSMCLCFYLICINSMKNENKKIFYVIYILQWINVFLTVSRSSILCCILSQVLLLFFYDIKIALKKITIIVICLIFIMGIGYLFIPVMRTSVINFCYMLLGVFDNKYAVQIASSFGNDNLIATGHRLSLYNWVFNSMKGKWIIGHGYNAQFNYLIQNVTDGWYWTTIKHSIEVESLSLLFHYGIIGMVPQLLLYFSMLLFGIKNHLKSYTWDSNLNFNIVIIVIMIIYLFYFLSNCMGSEEVFFYMLLSLIVAYNKKLS